MVEVPEPGCLKGVPPEGQAAVGAVGVWAPQDDGWDESREGS
jgi:hypothetical protein